MTIVEHLEELRTRLLISLAAFVVAMLFSFLFVEPILQLLIRPVGRVVFLAPTEAFFVRLRVAALSGAFLSLPLVLYQVWRFVGVGLTPTERRSTLSLLPFSLALFVGGAAFAFFAILPVGEKASPNQPDYRVMSQGIEIGAGWLRKGQTSGKEYVSLSIAAPEFGAKTLYANLGRAAGQSDPDVYALIWSPQD